MAGPTLSSYLGLNRYVGPGGGLKFEGVPPLKVSGTLTALAAATHAANTSVGGPITFPNAALTSGGGGIIQGAILRDKAGNEVPYDLLLFDSAPSAATLTDNVAFAFSTDLAKHIGTINFAGWSKGGTPGSTSLSGLGLPFRLVSGTTLNAGLIVRGTGATYASTSDISVDIFIL